MPSYLGQNFLKDSTYTIYIAQLVAKLSVQHNIQQCIEVGPGKGALTKKLITTVQLPLILLEKDETLVPQLTGAIDATIATMKASSDAATKIPQPQLIMGDALLSEPASILAQNNQNPLQTIVVGNLPYYITSPLLTHFFGGGDAVFPCGVFMVQKEVADKVKSDAEKKSFLRWLLNYQYDVRYCKTVPAKAFSPAPKVQSAIFSLVAKSSTPKFSYIMMVALLERISMYKRKTLGKIRKMAGEQSPDGSRAIPLVGQISEIDHIFLPEDLAGKRLEEMGREEMGRILHGTSS